MENATYNQLSAPPLGLRPRTICDNLRVKEIMEAVERYAAAGLAAPAEWTAELRELNSRKEKKFRIKYAERLNRVIADFDHIELKDIRITSNSPSIIYASVYIDGELNLSADLDMCFDRIRQ